MLFDLYVNQLCHGRITLGLVETVGDQNDQEEEGAPAALSSAAVPDTSDIDAEVDEPPAKKDGAPSSRSAGIGGGAGLSAAALAAIAAAQQEAEQMMKQSMEKPKKKKKEKKEKKQKKKSKQSETSSED